VRTSGPASRRLDFFPLSAHQSRASLIPPEDPSVPCFFLLALFQNGFFFSPVLFGGKSVWYRVTILFFLFSESILQDALLTLLCEVQPLISWFATLFEGLFPALNGLDGSPGLTYVPDSPTSSRFTPLSFQRPSFLRSPAVLEHARPFPLRLVHPRLMDGAHLTTF